MKNFQEITVKDLNENAFKLIGTDWTLITAGNKDSLNTMTASWGGVGVLWNKNVAFIFVRPQRYTREFLDNNDNFTLSFFDGMRDSLTICGRKSGRDCDKIAEAGLTPVFTEKAPYFDEARLVLVCRKLYRQRLSEDSIIDKSILKEYANNDFHYMYVAEIEKVLK